MAVRPGGEIVKRPLHFFFVCDCSGSMYGEKINSLNSAIREVIPHMREAADENPNAQVLVRAIKFANGASWHIASETPVDDFEWTDLTAEGMTDMGKALLLLSDALRIPPMTDRALPPVIVLVSDGEPTDDFIDAYNQLMALPWAKKAIKVSIAIGEDANLDVLQQFISTNERTPLKASNAEQLVKCVKWASTAVLKAASRPAAAAVDTGKSSSNVQLVQPAYLTEDNPEISVDDTW